jgi:hypothetical protein
MSQTGVFERLCNVGKFQTGVFEGFCNVRKFQTGLFAPFSQTSGFLAVWYSKKYCQKTEKYYIF